MRALAWISAFIASGQKSHEKDERGVVMTEYVVVIAIVVAGVLLVLNALWPALTGVITGAIADLPS